MDTQFNAVLSAPDGSVPGDARLVIRRVEPSRKERQAVQTQFGYAIVSAFEVTLERGGEEIGLSGEAELGLPVPADYQNGVVMICRLAEDGSVEACDTRRSGGIAYAMRDHLSKYAIIVPEAAAAMSGRALRSPMGARRPGRIRGRGRDRPGGAPPEKENSGARIYRRPDGRGVRFQIYRESRSIGCKTAGIFRLNGTPLSRQAAHRPRLRGGAGT
ncbi:MAG: hypothetical protein ACLVL7_06170 [Anaerotruncus massiliensis (ex Togo et al. 2019)]